MHSRVNIRKSSPFQTRDEARPLPRAICLSVCCVPPSCGRVLRLQRPPLLRRPRFVVLLLRAGADVLQRRSREAAEQQAAASRVQQRGLHATIEVSINKKFKNHVLYF